MLIRFDPFREFDRLTEQLASTATRVPRAFPMDAYRRGDQFIVEFDLPGVEPASIDLTVENNVLSVRSERRFEPREGDEVLVAERPHGTYTRQLFLADTLDSENVHADYEHGVLTLTIPVAEAAKPRRVQVGGGQDAQTIEPPDGRRRRGHPRRPTGLDGRGGGADRRALNYRPRRACATGPRQGAARRRGAAQARHLDHDRRAAGVARRCGRGARARGRRDAPCRAHTPARAAHHRLRDSPQCGSAEQGTEGPFSPNGRCLGGNIPEH